MIERTAEQIGAQEDLRSNRTDAAALVVFARDNHKYACQTM